MASSFAGSAGAAVQLSRGATVQFTTTFYDVNGAVTQPTGAVVNINYTSGSAQVAMTPPVAPAVVWTALWDSRNIRGGPVWWSIHTLGPGIPVSVEDGSLFLEVNPANLLTF